MRHADDERLARIAREKEGRGQRPSREEAAALRRVRRAAEEGLRLQYYASVPKKLWREWSGRQQKVLDEQAIRYGLPIGSATIELAGVVRWLHDFLAANARKLAKGEEREPDAVELRRREQYLIERARRRQMEARLVDRDEIRGGLTRFAAHIRAAGEMLQRHYGAAALKILNDRLDDAQAEVNEWLAPDDGSHAD